MSKKSSAIFVFIALVLYFSLASFQKSPGYMDADYHLYMGQRLAEGKGFTENILWNYLDDPTGLPHPSHSYWSPLPSLLAALGIKLFPSLDGFSAARFPFIVIAALIPALIGKITGRLFGSKKISYFAASIALFSPFYLPYLLTTDSFAPTMLLGALFFFILSGKNEEIFFSRNLFFLGALSALMYLSRAEGFIWFALALLSIIYVHKNLKIRTKMILQNLTPLILGFLIFSLPWLVRNLLSFNSLFPPGAMRSLWLSDYNQLFAFPASQLTFSSWINAGLGQIVQSRIAAISENFLASIAIPGSILLFPFLMSGYWKSRKNLPAQVMIIAWGIIFFIMSVIFPFSGTRGGYFHAAAALQPIFWSLAAFGLANFIAWGGKVRDWKKAQAWNFLGYGILLLALGLSAIIFSQRVIAGDPIDPGWNISAKHYQEISLRLDELGIAEDPIVLVNNPPGFALQSGRAAIVIPNGSEENLLSAALKYSSNILILEKDHPQALEFLYLDPSKSTDFVYIESIASSHIFILDE